MGPDGKTQRIKKVVWTDKMTLSGLWQSVVGIFGIKPGTAMELMAVDASEDGPTCVLVTSVWDRRRQSPKSVNIDRSTSRQRDTWRQRQRQRDIQRDRQIDYACRQSRSSHMSNGRTEAEREREMKS